MSSQPERDRLLLSWNDTAAEYPQDKCIHELFEAQVERTPDAVAVVFEEAQLTYRELNAKANQLARHLQGLGVGPEVLVGLCVERSLDMVVAMLGILKAGGAYVPLDPAYPRERLAFMLQDAELWIVVTQEDLAAEQFDGATQATPSQNLTLVCLDRDWERIDRQDTVNHQPEIKPDNLAYIIYTSGSTGKPKGVQIVHRSVVNLLHSIATDPRLSDRDTMLAVTTISFDVSVPEIYGPLTVGGRVVIASREATKDPAKLIELLTQQSATVMSATPATWRMLLEANWEGCKELKIICTGESLSRDLGNQLLEKSASVWNLYGPTEITVWATLDRVQPGEGAIAIGRPIANTQAYILDANREPVSIGEPGELHIGGAGLARGYLNRQELTEAKFIPNPFSQEADSRLYKTGDLARYRSDGSIECLGRIDHQVKIRGYRIELGEIEATLCQNPEVKQAVVIAREDVINQKRLVGYIVPDSSAESAETQDTAKQTEQWQKIWDEAYIQPDEAQDASFHIGGWNDSYTGKDLDPEQVREWVEDTVERILALQPNRLLEIGCGTGMLLFRMAPKCEYYYATDLSGEAIRYLEGQIQDSELASCVVLRQSPADGLAEIVNEPFDTAISNSVIQFFPSIDYLVEVIETAVKLVEPGGQIFLGDILSLPLLEAFHTSVQLYQAPASLSISQLKERINSRQSKEQRLIINPDFFIALKEHLPQISHVEIQLKRGNYQNELTRFRYDVVLHLGKKVASPATPPVFLNWQQDNLTVTTVGEQLKKISPEILVVTQVPNARIWADVKAIELLASPNCPETVEELRQQITTDGIEPEQWWQLQSEIPYRANVTWLGNGGDGYYDVVFVREDTQIIPDRALLDPQEIELQPWSAYANQPDTASKSSQLIPQLRDFLTEKLPDYMVPSAFVLLEELPLTPSGKIDRRALPAPDKSRPVLDVELMAPRTPTEEILVGIWTEVLNLNEVGVFDNFFMLGGDSIGATQLMSRVRDTFQIELSLHRLFESPTVAELSDEILGASRQELAAIQPISRQGDLPLSFAEQRLWFLDQLQEGSTTYNEQEGLRLRGSLQVEVLQKALQEIVCRHESLRTNYQAVDGSPVRVILPELNLPMPIIDLQHLPAEKKLSEVQRLGAREIQQPFDLANDPLLRVTLLQLATDDYVLLLTMHHIITDGWSTGILSHELEGLYGAFVGGKPSPLAPLTIQYADFAAWQRQPATTEVLAPQLDYWKQQLAGVPPLLELPTDYPRKTVQTAKGGKEFFELGVEFTQQLKGLSQELGVTLFMTLFAAFSTLLYRYSSQEDLVVGTPIANRNRSEIEGLIGFFVNTLVLRTQFEGNPSFAELLEQVRQTSLDAYAHQDVPFEQLVEALQPERSLSYSPIFQVMFALQNAPMAPLDLPGVSFNWLRIESAKAKFDLFLSMEETEAGLIGYWEYNRDLFEPATIRRAIGHFKTLLEGVVANPQMGVRDIPLLTPSERHQLLVEWNDTQAEYPQDKCIHQLFEEQVEQTPDAVAVVFEDEQFTYRELNNRANQLARYLQNLGVGAEVFVGICLERSLEMIVAILGILKAGGAYVPFDSNSPAERFAFMLADAGISILITEEKLKSTIPSLPDVAICLDTDWHQIAPQTPSNLTTSVESNSLAYIIYTSGSTGQPKGVLIQHQNVTRLFVATESWFSFNSNDVWTLFHSYAFDFSVWEIWGALLYGGTLVVVPYWISRSPQDFYQLLCQHQVTVLNQTPSAFRQLMQVEEFLEAEQSLALRLVIFGGEALEINTLKPWFDRHGDRTPQLVNMYGITETTVHVTYRPLMMSEIDRNGSPIGSPIPDLQVYILDKHLQPVPIGIPGELHIGGAGLARGYLNRPELTKQKFIPNPFSNEPGSRLYKTGDKARYLPDGNIEFIGRIDNQVKIRGFRIELPEIEATIAQHSNIREAVVTVRENTPDDKRLVAYIVIKEQLTIAQLRSFLKTKLPQYMMPSAFVFLDEIPLTPNGKINRRALPAPDTNNLDRYSSSIPVLNPMLVPQLDYWEKQLAGAPPRLELPTDYPRKTVQTIEGGKEFFELEGKLTEKLKHLSQESGVTLFITLFTTFSTLLYRYSSQEDIVVGTPIANHNRRETEGNLSFFVNTLALRTQFENNPSFTELLHQVRQTSWDAQAHQDIRFEQLVEALQPERSLSYTPIFQVMFALQNSPIASLEFPEVSFNGLPLESAKAKFDLTLSMEETEAGLIGDWEYNRDLFEPATIRRAIGHFKTLLEGIVTNPQMGIREIPLLTPSERHQLLVEWNDKTQTTYPQDKCIHQLFEEQVEQTPDAVAVVFEDKQLTYRELDRQANQLARYLQSLGVKPDVLVGICVERSLETIVGILGVLKAGGAYIPLNPAEVEQRLPFIFQDTQAPVLLTQQSLLDSLPELAITIVCLDADSWQQDSSSSETLPINAVAADNLAYVIYTSGSTGKPKGVPIAHRNLSPLLHWGYEHLGLTQGDRCIQYLSYYFDWSVWEIFITLTSGASLFIPNPEEALNFTQTINFIKKNKITALHGTPTQFQNLMTDRQALKTLKYACIGGEAVSSELVERSNQLLAPNCRIFNMYGPTEATIITTVLEIDRSNLETYKQLATIPIGSPVANASCYILNANQILQPIGIPGELCISGDGVALGYLNRPELSAEKFVLNSDSNFLPSERLYKTGDLVRWLPDGTIEFLGRFDHQVKIRGLRIELGEIEATLAQHPDVGEAMAILREDSPGEKRLVAYIVTQTEVDLSVLRSFVKSKLPDYMIPSAFVLLDAMPLTPNGKVDRRALPIPDTENISQNTNFIPPRTPIELQLSQIWSKVLNLPTVGVRDNFFDLGGHSLLAVRLMARIERHFGIHLPLTTLFTEPTIESQANLLNSQGNVRSDSPLVPIQTSGELPPLFCVHPIGGNVLCYAEFARHLGSNQPLYGLQSVGLSGDREPLTNIEEMAATYIEALQKIQPHGPYYLAGWSMGGVVAIEMAQQLQASGQEVALVALIDSYAPSAISELEADEASLANSLAADLGGLFGTELPLEQLDLEQLQPEEQLQQISTIAKGLNLLPPEVGLEQMGYLFDVFKANQIAIANYKLQPYSGRVALFCADASEDDRGWSSLTIEDLEIHTIPGNHYSIVREPDVASLTNQLATCLNKTPNPTHLPSAGTPSAGTV